MLSRNILRPIITGTALLAVSSVAHGFFGNMMNPGEWFDDDDDYYRYGRYGGGPYGYGGGPYGYGGGPYGWGGGPYGWGGGPYGWGGGPYGGYGRPSTIVVNPSGSDNKPEPKLPE